MTFSNSWYSSTHFSEHNILNVEHVLYNLSIPFTTYEDMIKVTNICLPRVNMIFNWSFNLLNFWSTQSSNMTNNLGWCIPQFNNYLKLFCSASDNFCIISRLYLIRYFVDILILDSLSDYSSISDLAISNTDCGMNSIYLL